ncbi:MAG: site-determining protein [Candidatus Micrarchaeota archaeon]|nr:MAG: site-determining protein [Candidatus Micrarchaeota archaeon]
MRILRVSSNKGGVGKSVIAINIAIDLENKGFNVLLIDADITNSSIATYLGLANVKHTFLDILKGKRSIDECIMIHDTGLRYVVSSNKISQYTTIVNGKQMHRLKRELLKLKYDYVIFDTAPGYILEDIASLYNMAFIVTEPYTGSYISALRLAKFYDKNNIEHMLIVNKIQNRSYELNIKEIEESYNSYIHKIPYDDNVNRSIQLQRPIIIDKPNSKFSRSISRLSERVIKMSD